MSDPPRSARDMPDSAGRLFVFEQASYRGQPACWRVVELRHGDKARPWPRRFESQAAALATAQAIGEQKGLFVTLARPRFTVRER